MVDFVDTNRDLEEVDSVGDLAQLALLVREDGALRRTLELGVGHDEGGREQTKWRGKKDNETRKTRREDEKVG